MKTAIVYASTHHGNTKKLLDAIAAAYEVDLIDAVKVRHAKPGYCALQFRGDLARFELAAQGWQDEPEQKQEKPSRGMKFK